MNDELLGILVRSHAIAMNLFSQVESAFNRNFIRLLKQLNGKQQPAPHQGRSYLWSYRSLPTFERALSETLSTHKAILRLHPQGMHNRSAPGRRTDNTCHLIEWTS